MNANRATRRVLVLTATALTLGMAACTSDGATPAASPTAAAGPGIPGAISTALAAPSDVAKQKATAAYLDMWHDVAEVATTSDWQSPKLGDHATGDALSVLSRQMYADHLNGLVSKGHPVNNPIVQSADPQDSPTTVMVRDCGNDSTWLKYRADTGQPADSEPGGARSITAEIKLATDGAWRVTRFAVEGVGTCTP